MHLTYSIGEGWEFEKQMLNMSTQLNSSNNVDVSTSAQLLPMQCYKPFF